MDVPFFSLIATLTRTPKAFELRCSGSVPFRRQSHRPTDYYPVTAFSFRPWRSQNISKTFQALLLGFRPVPPGLPRSPEYYPSHRAEEARPLRSALLGAPWLIAANKRQTLHRLRPFRREVPTSAAGSALGVLVRGTS